jgi:ankyrin repeat protein
MLISDTAGMGKSTVLTHLSKHIKQNFPAKWVVRIDLNGHTDALKALKQTRIDKERAIDFVSENVLKFKPGLEMELLRECCETKQKVRIVIMLDGFDEISPFYKETVIDLVQALRQTAVEQLWVTTRPHLRDELEDKLQQLSYTLEPFSERDQVEFLTRFWCLKDWFTEPHDKEEELQGNKLEIYAEHLIKKLATSIHDKDKEFTGIPLQSLLLAEAFDEEVKKFYRSAESMPELTFSLDLLDLYRKFIQRKYDIYQMEKFQVPVNNAFAIEQRERDLKHMSEDHHLLALKVLFTEEQVALFKSNSQCTFSAEQLTRIGIVQIRDEGKPHFIHRTFAEYCVADCLVNRLTEGNNTSEQVQDFVLKDIFRKAEFRVIRVFVDAFLSRSKLSGEVLQQYGNRMHNFGNDCVIIMHRAVRECNANIVAVLLDSLQAAKRKDTLVQLLLAQGRKRKTAWLLATERGNIQILQKLWECAKFNLTKEEINKFLLATGSEGLTALYVAARWGKLDILQKIWEWANQNLTTDEINNKLLLATDHKGMTALHKAAERGKVNTFRKIWDWYIEKITTEEINNELLLATDHVGRTVFHMAAQGGQLEVLQKIWEWAKKNLTTHEINNKLLLGTDIERKTVWHLAARWGKLDILHKIMELANENLTTEEIKNKLLLATDNKRRTAWHVAADWGKLEVLQKIWQWATEKLTTEEINNKLLLATDNEGLTAWYVAARWGKLDILQKIWEWANENLTTEEINNKLLLAKDNEGMTAWQKAAERGKLDIFQKIWYWSNEKLTTEDINNKLLLLGTDHMGRTICHVAAHGGQLEVLQKIREWAKENLTTEEIHNELFLATDNEGMTVWHVAAKRNKIAILQELREWTEGYLTAEEMKTFYY